MPDQVWGCPNCVSSSGGEDGRSGKEISGRGMTTILVLFILFPVLLFLLHLFLPGM